MKEIWKDIPEYEDFYQASNLGNIKNKRTSRILKPYKNKKNKYMYSHLSKNGVGKVIRTHKLIAKTFILNPHNYNIINHIDGDKSNNKASNLEWCSQKHNVNEAWRLGLSKVSDIQRKKASAFCKNKTKKVAQYDKNGKLIKIYKSQKEASYENNISKTAINNNVCGYSKSAGGYIWETIY